MTRVLVAGGGIGGLALAVAAARRGLTVTVLERAERFAELGAGIQLAPNAFRALAWIGLDAPVRRRAVFVDALRLMDGVSGEPVVAMPLTGPYRERFGYPYAVAHRGDLHGALLDACRAEPRVTLRAGQHVTGYQQWGSAVVAELADGGHVTGEVLVGADGIRSAIREQVVGDGEPRVSGHTIHRAVVPMAGVPVGLRSNTVTLWAGDDWHFVHYPIAGGEYLNLAITRDDGAAEVVTGEPVEADEVLDRFPTAAPATRRLLELGADWRTWVLCDRDPVDRWTDGRVALLGDAAHPMLQYAAQGAAMALEDAVTLGTLLGTRLGPLAPVKAVLEEYADLRRVRTAATTTVARALGDEVYHARGAAAVERNALLGSFTVEELHDQVDWLHAGRAVDGVGRFAERRADRATSTTVPPGGRHAAA